MSKKYKAMVLSCIDPRFQTIVFNYLKKDLSIITDFLEDYEYSIYSISEDGNLGNFDSRKTYENIIALKNDSPLNEMILIENL